MNTSKQNPEPAATENTGRDAQGRFIPGNPGGPGNPYGRRVAELRKIMLECVTDSEMRIIVGELMVQAKCGKLAAIKLLFQYILGKPVQAPNPDAVDVDEIDLYRRAPRLEDVGEVVNHKVGAQAAVELFNALVPVTGEVHVQTFRKVLSDPDWFYKECDRLNGLTEQGEEVDEEGAVKEEEAESVAAGAKPSRAAPSTNGGIEGNGRPSVTRPSANGNPASANRQAGPSGNGDNRRRSNDLPNRNDRPPHRA
jgi:hypothetical protein